MKITQFFKLLASISLPLGLGTIAGLFTAEAIPGWYETLNRPSFNLWVTFATILNAGYYLLNRS